MARRLTIHLSQEAEAVLQPLDEDTMSGRLNSSLIRYGSILAEETPVMQEREWCAVCDALNGTWTLAEHTDTDPARFVWAEIADSPELGPKWDIDVPALAGRLQSLSLAGRVAVVEVVRRFWTSPQLNQLAQRDLLLVAGARLE